MKNWVLKAIIGMAAFVIVTIGTNVRANATLLEYYLYGTVTPVTDGVTVPSGTFNPTTAGTKLTVNPATDSKVGLSANSALPGAANDNSVNQVWLYQQAVNANFTNEMIKKYNAGENLETLYLMDATYKNFYQPAMAQQQAEFYLNSINNLNYNLYGQMTNGYNPVFNTSVGAIYAGY